MSRKAFVDKHKSQNGPKFSEMTYDIMLQYGLSDTEIMNYSIGSGSGKVIDLINSFGIYNLIEETKKYGKSSRKQYRWMSSFNIILIALNIGLLVFTIMN